MSAICRGTREYMSIYAGALRPIRSIMSSLPWGTTRELVSVGIYPVGDSLRPPAGGMDRRVPSVSFTHENIAPHVIAAALAEKNIFVWSGHNYAVEVAKTLGIYDSGGAVRVGPVHYNSIAEIDDFLVALGPILHA